MIKLRVSDLDKWVQFVEEPEIEAFELSFEDFLAHMRREDDRETPQMAAGKAFHSLVEHGADADPALPWDEFSVVDAYRFFFNGEFAIERLPHAEFAVKKLYETPSGVVMLSGRVDGHDYTRVTDYKLTFSQFDAERYATSLQWRAYMDMMGAQYKSFRYEVFQGKLEARAEWSEVAIFAQHPLTFWTYPEMAGEVQRRIAELAEFAVQHCPNLIVPDETLAEALL